jgi:hypothetical protein
MQLELAELHGARLAAERPIGAERDAATVPANR